MNIGWAAILPVVLFIIVLVSVLIYFISKNNEPNSHKTIDPKPSIKKEESQ